MSEKQSGSLAVVKVANALAAVTHCPLKAPKTRVVPQAGDGERRGSSMQQTLHSSAPVQVQLLAPKRLQKGMQRAE